MKEEIDQHAAAEFFQQEYPPLFRYALFLTGEKGSAEELCQETLLRWFALNDRQAIECPRAWLKRVLNRLAINYFRRQKLKSRLETITDPEIIGNAVEAESDLQRLEIEDVLSRLPLKDQLLLKMRTAGLSYREIAEVMDISVGSVGTLLARSMKKFRHEYQEKEGGTENEMRRPRAALTISGYGTDC